MRMALTFVMLAMMQVAAMADTGPVIAIPSRGGVPVIVNGVDVSYAVLEADWGLGKSIHVQPTIYYGWPASGPAPVGRYFPRTGQRPGYGRHEVNTPPRYLPRAETFERSWSAESPRGYDPEFAPTEPPPIIYAPQFRGRRHR